MVVGESAGQSLCVPLVKRGIRDLERQNQFCFFNMHGSFERELEGQW